MKIDKETGILVLDSVAKLEERKEKHIKAVRRVKSTVVLADGKKFYIDVTGFEASLQYSNGLLEISTYNPETDDFEPFFFGVSQIKLIRAVTNEEMNELEGLMVR